jgi:uncharacterized OsmC-like protein
MLLQALVACAGVTLSAVATSLGIPVREATLAAEDELDLRGNLGVAKDVPVGFMRIRLTIDLDSAAPPREQQKLVELTERYCVVYRTLTHSPETAGALPGIAADRPCFHTILGQPSSSLFVPLPLERGASCVCA